MVKSNTVPDPTLPTNADTSVGRDAERQFGDLRGQFESSNRCLASIFGASDTLDEETHHFVANQLVHNPFIVNQHPRCCAIELVQNVRRT